MERIAYNPENVNSPYSTYSHALVVEGAKKFIFCSGQISGTVDGSGKQLDEIRNVLGEGNFEIQGEQVMKNLRNVLAAAGATFHDVVKLTTYVTKPENSQKALDLVHKHFGDVKPPPANTLCVLQELARPIYLLEIEAIAAV